MYYGSTVWVKRQSSEPCAGKFSMLSGSHQSNRLRSSSKPGWNSTITSARIRLWTCAHRCPRLYQEMHIELGLYTPTLVALSTKWTAAAGKLFDTLVISKLWSSIVHSKLLCSKLPKLHSLLPWRSEMVDFLGRRLWSLRPDRPDQIPGVQPFCTRE